MSLLYSDESLEQLKLEIELEYKDKTNNLPMMNGWKTPKNNPPPMKIDNQWTWVEALLLLQKGYIYEKEGEAE